jgi:hypothetical protein
MHGDASPAWRWTLVILCGAALAISLVNLTFSLLRRNAGGGQRVYATEPESEATHVAMLASMLVMFAAPHAPIPVGLWRTIFIALLLINGGLLVLRVRQYSSRESIARRNQIAAAAYHIVTATAMLYMTLEVAHSSTAHDSTAHHTPITAMTTETGTPATTLPYPVIGWAFLLLFAVDALGQIGIAATVRATGTNSQILFPSDRLSLFPHIAMDIAMAAMLIGALF